MYDFRVNKVFSLEAMVNCLSGVFLSDEKRGVRYIRVITMINTPGESAYEYN